MMSQIEKPKRGRKPMVNFTRELDDGTRLHNLSTFHFNSSDECAKLLSEFAKVHREDKNKIFKQAWQNWILLPDVSPVLEKEAARLLESGYKGDPLEKMYSSARYYYRKKALKEDIALTEDRETTPRKPYELSDAQLLEQINTHIIDLFRCDKLQGDISPAKAFESYITQYESGNRSDNKLKKIYKNRFFLLIKKIKEGVAKAT